jgi:hypothetical protein
MRSEGNLDEGGLTFLLPSSSCQVPHKAFLQFIQSAVLFFSSMSILFPVVSCRFREPEKSGDETELSGRFALLKSKINKYP